MLRIDAEDNYKIHLTRGDRGSIKVSAYDELNNMPYTFQVDDKISFVVVKENDYSSEKPVLRKDIFLTQAATEVEIPLTSTETKIGYPINKKTKYWYNVVLNDDITILGSDENGEKILILYPEVGENNG